MNCRAVFCLKKFAARMQLKHIFQGPGLLPLLRAFACRGDTRFLLLGCLALCLLIIMVTFSPPHAVFDEPYYLRYAQLLDRFGFSKLFLLNLPGSPGPLVAVVQYSFKPWTHFAFPQMRAVNVLVLGGILFVLSQTFKRLHPPRPPIFAFMVLAVPITWQMSGLALSDLPAVFFLSASTLVLLDWCRTDDRASFHLIFLAAVGGFLLGIAGLGRQIVLACSVAPLCCAFYRPARLLSAVAFAGMALLVVSPVFAVWRGLVPPSPLHVSAGLAPKHLLLSFAYSFFFILILAPTFYRRLLWLNIAIIAGGVALSFAWQVLDFAPLETVARGFGSHTYFMIRKLCSGVFVGAGFVFIINLFYHAWALRHDLQYLTCTVACFLIALAPLSIANNYSSRYTALALPFFLVLASHFTTCSVWCSGQLIVGSVLGALSLNSYYTQTPWSLPWEQVIRFGMSP